MEKIWIKDGKFIELSDDQLKELTSEQSVVYAADKAINSFDKKIAEASKGSVSLGDYNDFKDEIRKEIGGLEFKEDFKTEIHKKHAELLSALKAQGEAIDLLKESTDSLSKKEKREFSRLSKEEQLSFLLRKAMDSEAFSEYSKKNFRGGTIKFSPKELLGDGDVDAEKAVTGIAADHTGTIFITEQDPFIRDVPRQQPHVRDYLSVRPTDQVQITFGQISNYADVYNFGTQMLAENEAVTDVNFETSEVTSTVSRLGVSMPISKRYFKGSPQDFVSHVVANLPDAVMFKEDTQVLFGDGSGENLNGIITDARKFDLTPKTYVATDFASVESWNSGTQALVTMSVAHGLLNGDKVTIANATAGAYNVTHEDIIVKDEFALILNVAYVAEADTSAWTGTGASYWYQRVDNAQELDVLLAAKSILDAGLYYATALFVNPQTLARAKSLKGTDSQYVNYEKIADLLNISIVSHNRIPAGWFLIGDFSAKSVEMREYTPMSVQFLEDVTTQKGNYIVVLVDEEIHLVKHNPQWYIFDRFASAIAEIETP